MRNESNEKEKVVSYSFDFYRTLYASSHLEYPMNPSTGRAGLVYGEKGKQRRPCKKYDADFPGNLMSQMGGSLVQININFHDYPV